MRRRSHQDIRPRRTCTHAPKTLALRRQSEHAARGATWYDGRIYTQTISDGDERPLAVCPRIRRVTATSALGIACSHRRRVSIMVQTTSGTNDSADVQISLSNYGDGYATVRRAVSMVTGQLDFKVELRSSLVTMVGGMPTGSRGVVMSPNAHDGSSHIVVQHALVLQRHRVASRPIATTLWWSGTRSDRLLL